MVNWKEENKASGDILRNKCYKGDELNIGGRNGEDRKRFLEEGIGKRGKSVQ